MSTPGAACGWWNSGGSGLCITTPSNFCDSLSCLVLCFVFAHRTHGFAPLRLTRRGLIPVVGRSGFWGLSLQLRRNTRFLLASYHLHYSTASVFDDITAHTFIFPSDFRASYFPLPLLTALALTEGSLLDGCATFFRCPELIDLRPSICDCRCTSDHPSPTAQLSAFATALRPPPGPARVYTQQFTLPDVLLISLRLSQSAVAGELLRSANLKREPTTHPRLFLYTCLVLVPPASARSKVDWTDGSVHFSVCSLLDSAGAALHSYAPSFHSLSASP